MSATRLQPPQGLGAARFLMALSSISPIFFFWAIRGTNTFIPDRLFTLACIAAALAPNIFLALRIHHAIRVNDVRELVIGRADDKRDHLVVYLLAVLLPLYAPDVTGWRSLASVFAAVLLAVYIFWRLDLHYANVAFAMFGYRIFAVYPPEDDNPYTDTSAAILITKRDRLVPNERVIARRISDAIFLE